MSKADVIFNELIRDIHENGVWDKGQDVRTRYADGTPAYTKSIIGKQVVFEPEDIPIITTKQVFWRSSIAELWWIWYMRSNVVEDLRQLGSPVWNEWEKEDGTIQKAYGHQMGKKVRKVTIEGVEGKVDQLEYLILQLKNNKSSRRLVTSLWNINDLDEMALEPCVWSQQWIVQNNKLNLIVNQRSADACLGILFNWYQYKINLMNIAKLTDLEIGRMIWNYGHLHYYDRHEETVLKQIENPQYEQPTLIMPTKEELQKYIFDQNPTKEELHQLYKLENYKHNGRINYEIAI